jgi:S1-C subfamily serine protease
VHLPDAIDRLRPSIVQISVENGHERQVAGTGFLVHPDGFAFTARHVIEFARTLLEQAGGRLMAGLAIPELSGPVTIRASFELVTAAIVEEDERHDLALFQLDPNPFTSGKPSGVARDSQGGYTVNGLYGLAPLSLAPVRDGDAVAVSGYPSIAPALVTTHGVVASATATDVVEVQPPGAPDGFTIPDVKDSYLIDVAVNPGNSGGPVYSVYDGAAIGVCVAFRIAEVPLEGSPLAYNSGLAVAVPIRYALELLQRHASL